jgi:hypothetical protein
VGGNKPPVLVPPAPLPGAVPKPAVSAPLPPQVQQKLDQLKQNDKRRRR